MHVLEPIVLAYEPAEQLKQDNELVRLGNTEYFPLLQPVQTLDVDAPIDVEYVPATHGAHIEVPVTEVNVPAPHGEQAADEELPELGE